MQNCKKYKLNPTTPAGHHRQPTAECKNCVYFSNANCKVHWQALNQPPIFG